MTDYVFTDDDPRLPGADPRPGWASMVADEMQSILGSTANQKMMLAADARARQDERDRQAELVKRHEEHEAELEAMRLSGQLAASRLAMIGREEEGPLTLAEVFHGAQWRMQREDEANARREAIEGDKGAYLDPLPPEYFQAEMDVKRSRFRRNWLKNPRNAERLRRQVLKDELGIGESRRSTGPDNSLRYRHGGSIVRRYQVTFQLDPFSAALQDVLQEQRQGSARVVRSTGPKTVGRVFAEASRAMDYEDHRLRLRGEWITPISPPKQTLWDVFRSWFRLQTRPGRKR